MVKIYKCKFIGTAYYDEYEGYNLKYDETLSCINALIEEYPNNPKVILYKLEFTYSEEKKSLLKRAINLYESDTVNWSDKDASSLFEIGANFYIQDDDYKAIEYANKAQKLSDSIDLSLLRAKAYIRLGEEENAKQDLLENIDYDHDSWIVNQKGELLIFLDENAKALKLYERLNEKDSTFSNNESLYKIYLKEGHHKQARTFLVNDTIAEWDKINKLQNLANHDLKYSSPEIGIRSLRRMYKESYYDDFFGIKRLQLAFKAPLYYWTFGELTHILVLLLFIIIMLVLPYFWVLPIYSINKYFNFKKVKAAIKLPANWTLRHFWLISFLYILVQFVITLVFYYQEELNYYFDIISYSEDSYVESELILANSQLVFCGLLLIGTILFLNRTRLKFTLNSTASFRQIIGLSVLFVFFNSIFLKMFGQFVDLTETAEFITLLSAKAEILSILNQYGFYITILVVALIVPFYEEIIFRGIILTSTEKHIGFKSANVIQALLFATVHFSLKLFIFYFIFGIVTGYFVKRNNGLLTGIAFHALNNFAAVISIYYLSQLAI